MLCAASVLGILTEIQNCHLASTFGTMARLFLYVRAKTCFLKIVSFVAASRSLTGGTYALH